MTGSCRRLFATISLVLVALILPAPGLLFGQDVAARHGVIAAPVAPVMPPWGNVPPSAPVVLPLSPVLPSGNPIGRYPLKPAPILPQPVFFPMLVEAAGIIFSGHVTFVGHTALPQGPVPSSTTVTFQVEQAIRGTSAGQMLTIREWGGLWANGERYRVGEHVLLFLYAPSKLGLTSPVAGAMGRFATDSQGKVMMDPQHVATFEADPILGGKTIVPYADFARAVWHASGEE
ncbi:MAG: hypothetical protein ABSA78_01820 [Candidatus Sulfotelmatobacter sp.]|jgi:hypothetical protein